MVNMLCICMIHYTDKVKNKMLNFICMITRKFQTRVKQHEQDIHKNRFVTALSRIVQTKYMDIIFNKRK